MERPLIKHHSQSQFTRLVDSVKIRLQVIGNGSKTAAPGQLAPSNYESQGRVTGEEVWDLLE